MKKSELKQIIREVVEEIMKDDFAPLGVAEEKQELQEKSPPNFPKKLHDKLLKQYKDDEGKAYATMWKIFYAKKNGNKKIDEMLKMFEGNSGVTKTSDTVQIPGFSLSGADAVNRQYMDNKNKKRPSLSDMEDEEDRKRGWDWTTYRHRRESKNQDHDETDMNNPEEKREVELAKKAKEAAEEILKMHGK